MEMVVRETVLDQEGKSLCQQAAAISLEPAHRSLMSGEMNTRPVLANGGIEIGDRNTGSQSRNGYVLKSSAMQKLVGPRKFDESASSNDANEDHHHNNNYNKHTSYASALRGHANEHEHNFNQSPNPKPYPQETGQTSQAMMDPMILPSATMMNECMYLPYLSPFVTNRPNFIPRGDRSGQSPWHTGYMNRGGRPHGFFDPRNSNQRQFSNGPVFRGPASTNYMPARPNEMIWSPPRPVIDPKLPGGRVPEHLDLREKIIMQIEYYFGDINLPRDQHLRSLMDEQGWVFINEIADFPRLKEMSSDIPFIVEALQASKIIEIDQGDKIRRRDNWSKWLPQWKFSNNSSNKKDPGP